MDFVSFSKYTGTGNDFVLIDNRKANFQLDKALIQRLCHRQTGIGADGVILLGEKSPDHYHMRIFNSDGSEAEMCGNGIRCLSKFMEQLGVTGPTFTISCGSRILKTHLKNPHVEVEMGKVESLNMNVSIPLEGQTLQGVFMDTGVPHVVIFTQDLENIDLEKLGPQIRHHPLFGPRGTNVNFASILSPSEIQVRTYERGVEGETLACGTGASASAIASILSGQIKSPARVHLRSKEILEITLDPSSLHFTMKGPATFVFEGKLYL